MCAPYHSHAQLIYDDCIKATDFGDNNQDQMIIRPIGDICYKRCHNECKAFSRKLGTSELNDDHIHKCNIACRSGEIYSAKIREPNPDSSGIPYRTTAENVSSSIICPQSSGLSESSPDYIAYKTSTGVKPKDDIRIRVTSASSGLQGEVYMCGSNVEIIDPAFESMRAGDWSKVNTAVLDNSRGTYHARNYKPLDTGVDVRDGDLLSITYGGQYRYTCAPSTFGMSCSDNKANLNFYVKNPSVPFSAPYSSSNYIKLSGESMKVLTMDKDGRPTENPENVYNYNRQIEFYGLKGGAWEQQTRFAGGLTFDKDRMVINNGTANVYAKDRYTRFSGRLTDFSSRFTRLGVAHFDVGDMNKWKNHVGGYQVIVSRKGCPFRSGERLQYGISQIDTKSNAKSPKYLPPTDWFDVTQDNLQNNVPLNIPYEGVMYLRINPLPFDYSAQPFCSANDPVCLSSIKQVQKYYTAGYRDGQYYVEIQQKFPPGSFDDAITKIVRMIRSYLFGNDTDKPGTVQYLFNKMVADSGMMLTVRTLLVLYLTWTGLSFMVGIAQFTQKEAIGRVMKIAIVIALISPNSWEFFNTNFFKLFTDGSIELIARVTAPPDSSPAQIDALAKDPIKIFETFSRPFKMIFSTQTWLKIVALVFAGPLGFLLASLILFSIVIYAMAIVKAVLIYLISLIGMAVLLMLAPIFISFVLFQFTKQMFDSWIKHLLTFAFQPFIVFVFIFVLNILLEMSIRTTLGFTACKICWLSFTIPGIDSVCLIPGYTSLLNMHTPEATIGMPMHQIASVFNLMIISQAMYVFVDFGSRLAHQLITGAFMGINLSEGASNAIAEIRSYPSKIIGVILPDKESSDAGIRMRNRFGMDRRNR